MLPLLRLTNVFWIIFSKVIWIPCYIEKCNVLDMMQNSVIFIITLFSIVYSKIKLTKLATEVWNNKTYTKEKEECSVFTANSRTRHVTWKLCNPWILLMNKFGLIAILPCFCVCLWATWASSTDINWWNMRSRALQQHWIRAFPVQFSRCN